MTEAINYAVVGAGRQGTAAAYDMIQRGGGARVVLATGAYDVHQYYIPKTVPFTQDDIAYDFRALQDYAMRPPSGEKLGEPSQALLLAKRPVEICSPSSIQARPRSPA